MLAVLSPAKALDLSPAAANVKTTQPILMDEAQNLMKTTRTLSEAKIKELMKLSDKLAALTHERFQKLQPSFGKNNAIAAAFAFNGEVYKGLRARDFDDDELSYAQDHVAILSGLFGILRPLDLIQPYRLEMGTKLNTRRGQTLYAYWGSQVADVIDARLAAHKDGTLVNLASNEYFKVIPKKTIKAPIVECVFEDWKERPDDAKVISFLAKHARGLMARYMVSERVDDVDGLKDFAEARYRFVKKRSTDNRFVFSRKFIPASAKKK